MSDVLGLTVQVKNEVLGTYETFGAGTFRSDLPDWAAKVLAKNPVAFEVPEPNDRPVAGVAQLPSAVSAKLGAALGTVPTAEEYSKMPAEKLKREARRRRLAVAKRDKAEIIELLVADDEGREPRNIYSEEALGIEGVEEEDDEEDDDDADAEEDDGEE